MPSHWYPDTCPSNPPCMVTDDATVQPCAVHAALGLAHDTLIARLKDRNVAKNRAHTIAAADLNLAEGPSVPWRIDADDLIYLTVGSTAQRRNRIQSAIDSAIGAGKVVVE